MAANSSPPARLRRDVRSTAGSRFSYPWPNGIEFSLEELRIEDRNTEESHQRGLEQAKRDHAELRQTAIEVLNHYHIQEEQRRVRLEQEQQEARLRAEAELAAERKRLEVLKARSIPIPPPPAPEPEPAKEPPKRPSVAALTTTNSTTTLSNGVSHQPEAIKKVSPPPATLPSIQPTASPFALPPKPPATQTQPTAVASNPFVAAGPVTQLTQQVNGTTPAPVPLPAAVPETAKPDRHIQIHKRLKELRADLKRQADSNVQLKRRMGDMRREIRKSMGQLVEGSLSSNKVPVQKIQSNIREALQGHVPCEPVNPNEFLLEPRAPVDGAANNSDQLPSLFIYLLNALAKAAIAQFVNECGAKPQAADPVGTVLAKVFSEPEFQWRGGSMIDILLAKFRVVCPVLFGFRGSDKTEQGRVRVGWRKEQGSWVPEQIHVDRMTGLGAGFGALALRDFSRSKNRNPFPPSNYWTALAKIINTPTGEISDTQCYVLKAMIEHYEQKFIHFYGDAAVAALRVALLEFPARAPTKSSAVDALPVLAQIIRRDSGLNLQ